MCWGSVGRARLPPPRALTWMMVCTLRVGLAALLLGASMVPARRLLAIPGTGWEKRSCQQGQLCHDRQHRAAQGCAAGLPALCSRFWPCARSPKLVSVPAQQDASSSSPRKPPRTHQAQEEAVRLWVAALPGTGVCGGSPHTAHTPPSPPTPFATPVCDAWAWQISQWPPCCQPGWPPSAFTGRNPVPGGSDFPQPALTPLVVQGRTRDGMLWGY